MKATRSRVGPGRPPTAFRGVYPALVTPFTAQGDLDERRLAELVDYLVGQGVHGLVPLGSTGEFYALDPGERDRVLRVVLEAAAGRVPVVAGTNAGGTREVIAYSRAAEALGCAGVMLAPPYYSLPSLEELYGHFRAVDRAIGIPIMLYNYPGRTGVDMTPEFIARLAELERVRYVKESTGAISRMTEILRRCGDRLGVFCGCDTIALESFWIGAIGWVGGVVNVLPGSHVRLFDLAVNQPDAVAAREHFFAMLPVLEFMEGGGKYTQWVKAACELMGHPCGPPRPPLAPAATAERKRLRQALRACAEGRRMSRS